MATDAGAGAAIIKDDAAGDDAAAAAAASAAAAGAGGDGGKGGDDAAAAAAEAAKAGKGDDAAAAAAAAKSDDAGKGDWRDRIAGDDDKLRAFLGRYQSETAWAKAAKEDRDAIRAGKYLKPPGDNATDEEKAAWRTAMGVPAKVEDYLSELPDGLVIGDDDKEGVDLLANKLHEAGVPKAGLHAALGAYYELVEQGEAARAEATQGAMNEGIEVLRGEWGGDYKRNLNVMHGFLDTLPAPVQTAFRNGLMPDGTPIGYNAEALKWLAGLALEANPLATVVPGAGANQGQAIEDEKAAIEKAMRTDRPAYNKDEKMQARYRELVDAQIKMGKVQGA